MMTLRLIIKQNTATYFHFVGRSERSVAAIPDLAQRNQQAIQHGACCHTAHRTRQRRKHRHRAGKQLSAAATSLFVDNTIRFYFTNRESRCEFIFIHKIMTAQSLFR